MATDDQGDGDGLVTKVTQRSVGETVFRLLELVAAKGMKVFAVIDHSGEAEARGLDLRETRVVVFGDPGAGTPAMAATPLIALDLPLKVLVWDDAGQTKVTYTAPGELADRYRLGPELAGPLTGIDALTDTVVAR